MEGEPDVQTLQLVLQGSVRATVLIQLNHLILLD